MSETVNPDLTKAEQAIKTLALEVALDGGLAAMYVQAPWLLPFQPILNTVLKGGIDKSFDLITQSLDIGVIQFKNPMAQAAFEESAIKLRIIISESGIDSDAFKNAKQQALDAFADAVHFRG